MIAIVILAAGSSRRLGRPKQMEVLAGETLLGRAVRVARAAELGAIYVVVSADNPAIVSAARNLGCEVVLNQEASEGMASSIRLGVGVVPETARGVVVMTCDQPAVSAEHLRMLTAGDGEVAASAYAGRRGVPAYFPARCFAELLALRGDVGARDLLLDARVVELANGDLDVDSDEELELAREFLGDGRL